MGLISVLSTDGLYHLRAALAEARVGIDVELRGAVADITIAVANELRDNSPAGIIRSPAGGANPEGDSDGPLASSYMNEGIQLGEARHLGRVSTSQPTKLKYVRFGTGIYGPAGRRIYPVRAKALRWVGYDGVHFARSVAGQQPNDFVTPIVTRAKEEGKLFITSAVGAVLLETVITSG